MNLIDEDPTWTGSNNDNHHQQTVEETVTGAEVAIEDQLNIIITRLETVERELDAAHNNGRTNRNDIASLKEIVRSLATKFDRHDSKISEQYFLLQELKNELTALGDKSVFTVSTIRSMNEILSNVEKAIREHVIRDVEELEKDASKAKTRAEDYERMMNKMSALIFAVRAGATVIFLLLLALVIINPSVREFFQQIWPALGKL